MPQLAQHRTVASMPKSLDDIAKVLQDAAYVGIGLGVIAFQKAQVQRVELQKTVEDRLEAVGLRPRRSS